MGFFIYDATVNGIRLAMKSLNWSTVLHIPDTAYSVHPLHTHTHTHLDRNGTNDSSQQFTTKLESQILLIAGIYPFFFVCAWLYIVYNAYTDAIPSTIHYRYWHGCVQRANERASEMEPIKKYGNTQAIGIIFSQMRKQKKQQQQIAEEGGNWNRQSLTFRAESSRKLASERWTAVKREATEECETHVYYDDNNIH